MKKILLALLSLMLVLFPSCDNEVKETVPEPDYENNRTTIAIYVDGKEYRQDRIGSYEMFLNTMSKDNLSESITLTVKNTGDNPAIITVSEMEYIQKIFVESSIPEILQPGESADVKFTYTADADKGVVPGEVVGGLSIYGNFAAHTVYVRGNKVDVPIIKINPYHPNINAYRHYLGQDNNPPSYVRFGAYKAGKQNILNFGYEFVESNIIYSKLDSIEILGEDARYFNSTKFNEGFFSFEFTPTDKRVYEVTVRLHITCSDFNEYVRDMPLIIDVQSIDDSLFVSNEYYMEGDYSAIYTITPSSNGHAYIHCNKSLTEEGFIEIDENDKPVSWHAFTDNPNEGTPVDSWMDETNGILNVLVGTQNHDDYKLYYGIESYDIKNDTVNGAKEIKELEYSVWTYLGQSDDFLMFMKSYALMFVDKHDLSIITLVDEKNDFIGIDADVIHSDYNGTPVNKVIYNKESDTYILAGDDYIHLAHINKDLVITESRKLHLGNDFTGKIKDVINVSGGFYVLNDSNQIFKVTITDLNCKVELIDSLAGNIALLAYVNDHLYYKDTGLKNVFAYDMNKNKIIPICSLELNHSIENDYMIYRNSNLYYSATYRTYYYGIERSNGYIRRIPLI